MMICQKYSRYHNQYAPYVQSLINVYLFLRYFWEASGEATDNVYCQQSGMFRTVR